MVFALLSSIFPSYRLRYSPLVSPPKTWWAVRGRSNSVVLAVIPAAFHSSLSLSQKQALEQTHNDSTNSVLIISRGTSIILLFVYAAYRA